MLALAFANFPGSYGQEFMRINDAEAAQGENLTVVLYSSLNAAGAITLKIDFDTLSLRFISSQILNADFSSTLINSISGSIYLSWEDIAGVTISDEAIISFTFEFTGISSLISFDQDFSEITDTAGNPKSITYLDGLISPAISFVENSQDNFRVFRSSVYPNPFNSSSALSIESDSETKMEVKIFDLTGQLMNNSPGRFEAIKGRFSKNLDFSAYPSGQYFIMVRAIPFEQESGSLSIHKVLLLK